MTLLNCCIYIRSHLDAKGPATLKALLHLDGFLCKQINVLTVQGSLSSQLPADEGHLPNIPSKPKTKLAQGAPVGDI